MAAFIGFLMSILFVAGAVMERLERLAAIVWPILDKILAVAIVLGLLCALFKDRFTPKRS